jgi:hypothetical protein
MLIVLSLLVCLLGLLMYALAGNPRVSSIGFEMFKIGLFTFLLCFCMGGGGKLLGILPR